MDAGKTSERTDGELIAIDGKTLRSSYDRDSRQFTIHMISAFAAQNRLVWFLPLLEAYIHQAWLEITARLEWAIAYFKECEKKPTKKT